MEDIVRIVLAFVIGYVMFMATFYYLAKLMFPKVEVDEDYEKMLVTYKKVKRETSRPARRFDPSAFRLSNELRHRINYTKA